MPRESTTFDVTARMTTVVIMVSAISVTPKLEEYMDAVKRLFVDEEDKQAESERKNQRDCHIKQADARNVFQKA